MKEEMEKDTINKYYTPTIEEFHVGFEYETMELGSRTKYNPTTLNEWDDLTGDYDRRTLLYEIARGGQSVRVKYLDKEDIESLGFELRVIPLGEDTEEDELGIFRKETGAFEGTFFLDRALHNCNIEFFNCYFTIKNKSELKKLLKQLNIN